MQAIALLYRELLTGWDVEALISCCLTSSSLLTHLVTSMDNIKLISGIELCKSNYEVSSFSFLQEFKLKGLFLYKRFIFNVVTRQLHAVSS